MGVFDKFLDIMKLNDDDYDDDNCIEDNYEDDCDDDFDDKDYNLKIMFLFVLKYMSFIANDS